MDYGYCPHCNAIPNDHDNLYKKSEAIETIIIKGEPIDYLAKFIVCTACGGNFSDPEYDSLFAAYLAFEKKMGVYPFGPEVRERHMRIHGGKP